uniref:Uncharacterized protein n=1 Tax=Caenorhabditis japonica TaxID=281687 RepID=A0A8R1I7Y2_CAEJA
MTVDLKQQLELIDYLGVIAVWCIFFAILFFISIILNFACIKEDDDITALERVNTLFSISCGQKANGVYSWENNLDV